MTPESLRVKQWREANRERYNETQRVLMEKRRRAAGVKKREPKKAKAAPDPAVRIIRFDKRRAYDTTAV